MSSWFSGWGGGLGLSGGLSGLGLAKSVITIGGRQVRLQRVLAEGGYAVVFAGQDVSTGEGLAVKRIIAADRETADRAEGECQKHAQLRHEHILPFMGMTKQKRKDGGYEVFLLLPLCDGGHLWDYASTHLLSLRDKLRVVAEVASALAYMHAVPLAHLDLKLENILLDDDGGGQQRCLLCDFGSSISETMDCGSMSRKERLDLEDHIARFCTPMYRAPEMVDLYAGLSVGPPADVWALGCICYVLCFGLHPFGEASAVQIITAAWAPPRDRVCDASMLELIGAMLRPQPTERPEAKARARPRRMHSLFDFSRLSFPLDVSAAARALISDLASGIDEPQRIARLRAALNAPPAAPAAKGPRAAGSSIETACACGSKGSAGHQRAHADPVASGASAADAARTEALETLRRRAERLRLWEHALLRPPKPPHGAGRLANGMNVCAQIKST